MAMVALASPFLISSGMEIRLFYVL